MQDVNELISHRLYINKTPAYAGLTHIFSPEII